MRRGAADVCREIERCIPRVEHLAAVTQLGYRQNRLCTSGITYLREMHAALLCHLSLRKCLFLLALRYLKE